MRKSKLFIGLLFIFVFVFSLAFTSANRVQADGTDPKCCAYICPGGDWVRGHLDDGPGGQQVCSCIPTYENCTHYCGACAQ